MIGDGDMTEDGDEVEVLEGMGETEVEALPLEMGDAFEDRLGQWLAAWAHGRAPGQQAAFLDRLVKQRMDKFRPPRRPEKTTPVNERAIVERWIDRFIQGGIPVAEATAAAAGKLTRYIEEREAAAREEAVAELERPVQREPAPARVRLDISEEARSAMEQAQELNAELEEAHSQLAKAHDWRFRLEAKAREAYDQVRFHLRRNAAPTKEQMETIMRTLRDGIEGAL